MKTGPFAVLSLAGSVTAFLMVVAFFYRFDPGPVPTKPEPVPARFTVKLLRLPVDGLPSRFTHELYHIIDTETGAEFIQNFSGGSSPVRIK